MYSQVYRQVLGVPILWPACREGTRDVRMTRHASLPAWAVSVPRVWEYARSKHEDAAYTLQLYEDEGVPFILTLRDFGNRLTFPGTSFNSDFFLENHLFDYFNDVLSLRGPSDRRVGVIQVQQQEPDGYPSRESYNKDPWSGMVYAPSFYLPDSVWMSAVRSLVWRAELIVVTLTRVGHGLSQELEAIAENGRTDRTVVIFTEMKDENFNQQIVKSSALKPFMRIISHASVNPQSPIDTFVFNDLEERLMSILRTPRRQRLKLVRGDLEYRMLRRLNRQPGQQAELAHREFDRTFPISWSGVGKGYQELAATWRAEGRNSTAALYSDCAARIARAAARV